MRIAVLQQDYVIGDFANNSSKILSGYNRAVAGGAQLVCTPAAALSGFPVRALYQRASFRQQEEQVLADIKKQIGAVPLLLTYGNAGEFILLQNGKDLMKGPIALAKIDQTVIALSGSNDGNSDEMAANLQLALEAGARLFIRLSADPFDIDNPHPAARYRELAKWHGVPVVYVNQIGAQDNLIFAGGSQLITATGQTVAEGADFNEDLLIADLDLPEKIKNCAAFIPDEPATAVPQIHPEGWEKNVADALCLGLKDYVTKCGFKKILIGLSGGIDSALVATLAVRALGAGAVHGITMPSRYSPEDSPNDAISLAKALGITIDTIPIEPIFAQGAKSLQPLLGDLPWGLAEENMQARIRGLLLMTYSNKFGHLVLATGNKSELAVGYSTLYGDMCGGLELIGDLYKTDVYKLSAYLNREAGREIIPNSTLTKPPSAELAPGQKDQDSLPPYDILDDILRRYVDNEQTIEQIIAAGHDENTVNRVLYLLRRAEYKRAQAAPVLQISGLSFGPGRDYPIVQAFKG